MDMYNNLNLMDKHKLLEIFGVYYYGRVLELDGCHSTGETFNEAYKNLLEAMEGWLDVKLQYNDPIPEPVVDDGYSGKFVVRLPKSLHRKLAIEAEKWIVNSKLDSFFKVM